MYYLFKSLVFIVFCILIFQMGCIAQAEKGNIVRIEKAPSLMRQYPFTFFAIFAFLQLFLFMS